MKPPGPAGDRCALTDLPAYSCGHCTGADARARAAERETRAELPPGTRIIARYQGRCAACDGPLRPGEVITADPEGHGWLCPECADIVT